MTERKKNDPSGSHTDSTGVSATVPTGKLTLEEVKEAFLPLQDKYGPILFIEQAVEISGNTRATLLKKVSQGEFRNSVVRGRPVRFWRDRFVLELMTPRRPQRRGKRVRSDARGSTAATTNNVKETTAQQEVSDAIG